MTAQIQRNWCNTKLGLGLLVMGVTGEGIPSPSEGAEIPARTYVSSLGEASRSEVHADETVMSAATTGLVPGSDAFAAACRERDMRPFGYRLAKRAFDVVFSVVVLAIGFVPGALLSLAIAMDTKGTPIYSQERAGRLGRPFRIYKFRTMVADADDVEKHLTPEQLTQWKHERKVDNDPRITKLGRILRKTSLDELPQFFNVLVGQVSVVGPRVISYDELNWYTPQEQLELLAVPQGITGLWQVTSRNEATFRSGERQRLELEYVQSAGIATDACVFAKTFGVMLGKRKTGR